jgi:hypothetical protein
MNDIMHRLRRIERGNLDDLEYLVNLLFRIALIIGWFGISVTMLYAVFKNGMPPERR